MKYILINPVVLKMYDNTQLITTLKKLGYNQVSCNENWAEIVKNKYKNKIEKTDKTTIDARCPLAKDLALSSDTTNQVITHEIEPILISSAREISQRGDLAGVEKVVVTPCKCLADMGNNLKMKETTFYSWIDFCKINNINLSHKNIITPIPLGYFKDLDVSQTSISGHENIENYFKNNSREKLDLVELLYCDDGCHNGDGVTNLWERL